MNTTKYPGVYERNGRFYIDYQDSMGKRRRQVTPARTAREAKRVREKILETMELGGFYAPSRMTVSELADEYMDTQTGHMKDTTRVSYQGFVDVHVKKRLGHIRVNELNVNHVSHLVSTMRAEKKPDKVDKTKLVPKYSPHTIQNVLKPLSQMMRYAVRRGWAAQNPVEQLTRQERPSGFARQMRILDRDEIALVVDKAPPSAKLLFRTAIFTGLRQGELFRLTWKDVDFDKGEFRVNVAKTKAGVRAVVVPAFLLESLATKSLESHGEAVFHSGHINPRTWASNARRSLSVALERAGITDRVRFHDLRHTFASIHIAAGRNPVWISKQMGHSSPQITLSVYAGLFDGAAESERAMKAMEEMFG